MEEEHEKIVDDKSKKIVTDQFKRRITKVVGIVLLAIVISVSLIWNLNESDFRSLALFSLLIYGLVWSEQYKLIAIFLIGLVLLFFVLVIGLSVRF